jgi:peroxiredoxin Q/BCP
MGAMSLKIGDEAPSFDVTASDGRRLRLEEYRGKKVVVLYFYPKDNTRVCTAEACGFRDMYEDLAASDVEIIGVSIDSDASHRGFAEKHRLPFPLVADPDKALARRYGATGGLVGLVGLTKRVTFVIDKNGRVAGIFDSMRDAGAHLDGVRTTVNRLRSAA